MILPDYEIRRRVRAGEIGIEPFDHTRVQPASVDLTLDRYFRAYKSGIAGGPNFIDPKSSESQTYMTTIKEHGTPFYTLRPGRFVLASTIEKVRIPTNMVARLEGKSSLARMGLVVHVTAGFFDPGFEGFPTLELFNCNHLAIRLYPGMPICQMSFEMMTDHAFEPYTGKYQNQEKGPQESRYFRNFEDEG